MKFTAAPPRVRTFVITAAAECVWNYDIDGADTGGAPQCGYGQAVWDRDCAAGAAGLRAAA